MAVLDDLLDRAVTALSGLSLTVGAVAVTVEKGKLPLVEEGVESLPRIAITPSTRAGAERFFSSGDPPRKRRTHRFDAVLITAGNRDRTSDMADLDTVRQAIMRTLGNHDTYSSLSGNAEALLVVITPDPPFDRTAFASNYDYSPIGVAVDTIEPAW